MLRRNVSGDAERSRSNGFRDRRCVLLHLGEGDAWDSCRNVVFNLLLEGQNFRLRDRADVGDEPSLGAEREAKSTFHARRVDPERLVLCLKWKLVRDFFTGAPEGTVGEPFPQLCFVAEGSGGESEGSLDSRSVADSES